MLDTITGGQHNHDMAELDLSDHSAQDAGDQAFLAVPNPVQCSRFAFKDHSLFSSLDD
jgi:hypothetical protein